MCLATKRVVQLLASALPIAVLACTGIRVSVAEEVRPLKTVVFVCEHGSVKSLMAAKYFEQAAQQRGLSYRSVSRGITPDHAVPARIVAALASDGENVATFKPKRVEAGELAGAIRVVAIGVDPAALPGGGPVESWNDVPASTDYAVAKAALQQRVEALLNELEKPETKDH